MVVDYKISANNKDITDIIKENLISLSITDTIGDHADSLTIRLSDSSNNIEFPAESSKIEISLGYKDNLQEFGVFFVDNIGYKYPPSLIDISSNSIPFVDSNTYLAMQTQKTRSFDDISISELVNMIAKEHGLDSIVSPKIGTIKISHIDQTNEGNIAFLRRVIHQYGGILKPTHSKLLVLFGNEENANGDKITALEINFDELSQISYSSKREQKFKSVLVNYQDISSGELKNIIIGSGQPQFQLSETYPNLEAAKIIGQKQLDHYNLDSDSLNITTVGNPDLIAGMPLDIIGLREDIPQNWYIQTATHSISKSGYQTSANLTLLA